MSLNRADGSLLLESVMALNISRVCPLLVSFALNMESGQ